MVEDFTYETFDGLVGDTFHIAPPDGEAFDVTLSHVEQRQFQTAEVPPEARKQDPASSEQAPDKPAREPFSLLFHAPSHEHADQHIFKVTHDKLGEFDLFLVPHGADPRGMAYGAEFA